MESSEENVCEYTSHLYGKKEEENPDWGFKLEAWKWEDNVFWLVFVNHQSVIHFILSCTEVLIGQNQSHALNLIEMHHHKRSCILFLADLVESGAVDGSQT